MADFEPIQRALASGQMPTAEELELLSRLETTLLDRIQSPTVNNSEREAALLAVAYLTTQHVETEIRRAFAEPSLQGAAIEAMGRNCQPIWIPDLLREMDSPDPDLRMR